jgi:LysM repeat protein
MTISANTPTRVVVLLTAIVVVLVLLLATAVGATIAGAGAPGGEVQYATHRVTAGDTLWDIAGEYTAPGDDVRHTVYDIKAANGLDGSIIVPGQELLVPISD